MLLSLILFISLVSFTFGLLLYTQPLRMFEIQRRFYAKINWRIEPISIEKEIRNTKAMGVFLMLFVAGALTYYLIRLR